MDLWKSYLETGTINSLPADFAAPTEGKVVEGSVELALPSSTLDDLSTISEAIHCSQYQAALALFILLVRRLTGDEDVTVGAAVPELNFTPSVARYSHFAKSTTLVEVVQEVINSESIAQKAPFLHSDIQAAFDGQEKFRALFLTGSVDDLKNIPTKDLALILDQKAESIRTVYNLLLYKKQRILYVMDEFLALISGCAASNTIESLQIGSINLVTPSQVSDSVIPNPTEDLDWGNFRGSIQDIFARNAAAFPDRECIIETGDFLSGQSKNKTFTYRQIDEASNIIAHYLVSKGIVVDDVVMIYAYRGVDLVVAVMGVLKAGATFSVIDPAYPGARQNIYLGVAKPKGLIVLQKAGKLSPSVKAYIKETLALKAEILDLELLDDGEVTSKSNMVEAAKKRRSQTGIPVGPDNHPTLSFTSGSEGVPKGVRGRHFSLAYYFPWMSKTFGINENDKFTMLSGIAHDPIQRDMFTPLFLGAKLYVPTAEDIGTPGRLAEWMAKTGCTVTHLTPAMGQLLSAQASSQIPELRNAFFVGDILTKRDCVKLQALAHNVAIINMYGTTETQRAVSFFRVPSISENSQFLATQKDIIPAGRGMINVQMLVVNRDFPDQLCGVGELGEIYVRAGGLSDGYLDLPEMTAEKFLTNWFQSPVKQETTKPIPVGWMGPRDRLYRTGDLGRYLPDGNTEVSGRADDQIKIRGFRIELGEINTHLSNHRLVRENVTLMRRDKDEEPVLVAYVVPETNSEAEDMLSAHESLEEDETIQPPARGLVKYQRLIKDIRSYLKTKLPSYAVPSLIVPLSRLPLNPNGKIDKPRLPFPDTAQMELAAKHLLKGDKNAADSAWTDSELKVRDLWLTILPSKPPTVELSDSFFDLGGHSILATKMIFDARAKFGVPELPLGTIFASPSIQEFARAIESIKGDDTILVKNMDSTSNGQHKASAKSYADDYEVLSRELPTYLTPKMPLTGDYTVLLTGVTGFLGSFVLKDLLDRSQTKRVIAHVRAKDNEHGFNRIRETGMAYGIWNESFSDRIRIVTGSLEEKNLGLSDAEWTSLVDEVDVVIHNGALVHWVYPYETLRGPNVIGTVNILKLCSEGKPKYFTFVSSTSVLDTQFYVDLSDSLKESGNVGIPETDNLEGSKTGLGTGYGQSKWVSERLLMEAGRSRGLRGCIVRPGYVVGESTTGISNTDDFLLRMWKGSQELGLYPDISNTVNMVPVDHVARVIVAAALNSSYAHPLSVAHVTSHPRITFNEFLGSLRNFGYGVKETEYFTWKTSLEKHVVENKDSALFPLLHFVLDNLPQDTKAPELDDTNARNLLAADAARTGIDKSFGAGVTSSILGVYLSFLVAIGFIDPPQNRGHLLPTNVSKEVILNFSKAGGRSR